MSRFRDLLIMNAVRDNCLSFQIVAEAGQTFSWQPQGYWGKEYAAIADIGYGKQTLDNNEVISRTYEVAGSYEFKIYECYCNYAYWRGDVNICGSNEKWAYLGSNYKQFYHAFNGMVNSTFNFKTLPPQVTTYTGAFIYCTNARFPDLILPNEVATTWGDAFRANSAFCSHFVNLPDKSTILSGMFASATGTGTVTLTELPPNVTTLSTFAYAARPDLIRADLDELAENAPEGGYQALTNLYYAFSGQTMVTGSRSAFLAACPNVTNTTNAFLNTNTTE